MSDHPSLFSASMVCAMLDNRKTQTRRILTPHNTFFNGSPWSKKAKSQTWDWDKAWVDDGPSPAGNAGPYLKLPWLAGDADPFEDTIHRIYPKFQSGDRIWVKENHRLTDCECTEACRGWGHVWYDADETGYRSVAHNRLRPSIHMPRWASRLTLQIRNVRIERLQDISEADALAEGIERIQYPAIGHWGWPQQKYRELWNHINGPDAWDKNPWVLAYTFYVNKQNIDEVAA